MSKKKKRKKARDFHNFDLYYKKSLLYTLSQLHSQDSNLSMRTNGETEKLRQHDVNITKLFHL